MYPCRVEYPRVGDKVVYYDDTHRHFVMLFNCGKKRRPVLEKDKLYTITSVIPGTGMTFVTFEEVHGDHDLSDFVRPNDILLRKNKLDRLNDRIGKSGKGIRKV